MLDTLRNQWQALQAEKIAFNNTGPPKDNTELERRRELKARIQAFKASLTADQQAALMPPKNIKKLQKKQVAKKKNQIVLPPALADDDNINNNISPDYLLVLDFEATCDQRGRQPRPQEIIEWPTLLLNVATGQVEEDEFHYYILPDLRPQLSDFCTQLTGITQSMVDHPAISLKEVMYRHERWLAEHNLVPLYNRDGDDTNKKTFLYLTCGDWDLKTALPHQLAHHGTHVPRHFRHWINVKKSFQEQYQTQKAKGMTGMLAKLNLQLEGRHHSGIDDCRNIARICQVMIQDGWEPKCTSFAGNF